MKIYIQSKNGIRKDNNIMFEWFVCFFAPNYNNICSSERWVPERSRPPRCPLGPGGLLPRYSRSQSTGRQYLYSINNRDYQEGFLAYECIRGNPFDIRALISTKYLRIFTCTSGEPHVVTETHLRCLFFLFTGLWPNRTVKKLHWRKVKIREWNQNK